MNAIARPSDLASRMLPLLGAALVGCAQPSNNSAPDPSSSSLIVPVGFIDTLSLVEVPQRNEILRELDAIPFDLPEGAEAPTVIEILELLESRTPDISVVIEFDHYGEPSLRDERLEALFLIEGPFAPKYSCLDILGEIGRRADLSVLVYKGHIVLSNYITDD